MKKRNKKKKTDVHSTSQQILIAFQSSNVLIDFKTSVYFDSNAFASTEAYFDMFNS